MKELDSNISVVVLDIRMQHRDGFQVCNDIREQFPNMPVIFFSAYPKDKDPIDVINDHKPFAFIVKSSDMMELEQAIQAAFQYTKGFEEERISTSLTHTIEDRYPLLKRLINIQQEDDSFLDVFLTRYEDGLKQSLQDNFEKPYFFPDHQKYQQLFDVAKKSIQAGLNLLVSGDEGVGKDGFVATAVEGLDCHVVTIDCRKDYLLKDRIFEWEFGNGDTDTLNYQKLRMADRGVLYLKNIEFLTEEQDAFLSKVVYDSALTVYGELTPLSFSVIVTDSGEWTKRSRQNGSQLYEKVKPVTLELPNLDSLKSLIPDFMNHFCQQLPEAVVVPDIIVEYFEAIEWPTNIKGLYQAMIDFINNKAGVIDLRLVDHDLKKRLIEYVLERQQYNIQEVAQYLGMKRPNLYKLIETLSIDYKKRGYKKGK